MPTVSSARADRPATPSEDLAAWSQSRRPGSGILTPDITAFCVSGVSIVVAAREVDGRAIAGLAIAARAERPGTLRVILRQPANRSLLAAVEAGSPIAATFSRPRDHRSIQLKAMHGLVLASTAEDLSAAATQAASFRDALVAVGYTPAFAALYAVYAPGELAVLSFMPEQAFVQTPGPGAGGEIPR